MTEDALMRNGTVILQSCTVTLDILPCSCCETSISSSGDAHGVIRIKVEEVPEPISFPTIKLEPEEVSYCLCDHYTGQQRFCPMRKNVCL
jgi:hypothetical protein